VEDESLSILAATVSRRDRRALELALEEAGFQARGAEDAGSGPSAFWRGPDATRLRLARSLQLDLRVTNLRILVVDDDPAMRDLLAEQLVEWRCRPFKAGSTGEALRLMARRPIDLVLSDLRLPREDGFALLRQVRKRWPATSVILMSGFPTEETGKQAVEAGAAAFLSKPFSLRALFETLESVGR
jgi:DNA-binding response OmpR family regulator